MLLVSLAALQLVSASPVANVESTRDVDHSETQPVLGKLVQMAQNMTTEEILNMELPPEFASSTSYPFPTFLSRCPEQ